MVFLRRIGISNTSIQHAAMGLVALACSYAPVCAADVGGLIPGLIATFEDFANEKGARLVQMEPVVALNLRKNEAVHPRLGIEHGTMTWRGHIKVLRGGTYRFSGNLCGKLKVRVGTKTVLQADVKASKAIFKAGPEIRLEAGVLSFAAEFTRYPGPARVELFWRAAHFHEEPIPHHLLGHFAIQETAALRTTRLHERGLFLAEELNCVACHRPVDNDRLANGLRGRQGPDLSKVGERVFAGWIYHWLAAPDKIRPGTAMPRLFGNDKNGGVDRYAVARYLSSLGGPLKPAAKKIPENQSAGKQLFATIGCVACHAPDGTSKPRQQAELFGLGGPINTPLTGLGSKTTAEKLALFLENPLALNPGGRMPRMNLTRLEAVRLANHLCGQSNSQIPSALPMTPSKKQRIAAFKRVDARPEEIAAFEKQSDDSQWNDLGKRLVIEKGCNNCHTIAPGGKMFAMVLASAGFGDLRSRDVHSKGCLAPKPNGKSKSPWFVMSASDKHALTGFLSEASRGLGSAAPAHHAKVTLKRFNCLACHARNGQGGLDPQVIATLRKLEKAENAEAVAPPPLTGVGHKLLTPWLSEVLTKAGKARPWMGLRMPQFGETNVGHLAQGLALMEGAEPLTVPNRVKLTPAKIELGRALIGKTAFGCISCHDIAGIPNTGTRGPDLADTTRHVRFEWFRRWLQQAQRMQPGTRMPSVFPDGKSTLDNVLEGNADAQADAMWAYLSLGRRLHLPEGMEPQKGLELKVGARPRIFRTFLQDAGNRAIAIGFPGGISMAFDTTTCRLAYAWSGKFLDASPVWHDRGGRPANVLGPRFWTAPLGCPWSVGDSQEPPDFSAQAKNPAFGAEVQEGELYRGASQLTFRGLAKDKQGTPLLRYELGSVEPKKLFVQEKPVPLYNSLGFGVERQFQIKLPPEGLSWLYAGQSNRPPRVFDAKGKPLDTDFKNDNLAVTIINRFLVLSQDGGQVTVLSANTEQARATWQLVKKAGIWRAMIKLSSTKANPTAAVTLQTWTLQRFDPNMLKELAPSK